MARIHTLQSSRWSSPQACVWLNVTQVVKTHTEDGSQVGLGWLQALWLQALYPQATKIVPFLIFRFFIFKVESIP